MEEELKIVRVKTFKEFLEIQKKQGDAAHFVAMWDNEAGEYYIEYEWDPDQ